MPWFKTHKESSFFSPQRSLSSSPQRGGTPLSGLGRAASSSPIRSSAVSAAINIPGAGVSSGSSDSLKAGHFSIGSASPKDDSRYLISDTCYANWQNYMYLFNNLLQL